MPKHEAGKYRPMARTCSINRPRTPREPPRIGGRKDLHNRSASHHWASGSLSSASQSSHHSIGPISIVPVYSFPLMASCISSSESAENLQPRGETGSQRLTRVAAPVTAAHAALAHAHPDTMEPLGEDSRDHVRASTSGGVAQRWILGSSAQRRPQAQRSVGNHGRKPSKAAAQAFSRSAARPVPVPPLPSRPSRPWRLGCTRLPCPRAPSLQGRAIARGAARDQTPHLSRWGVELTGALPSSLAAHEALIAPPRCCLRATNALDEHRVPPPPGPAGGVSRPAAGGTRLAVLKVPRLLASSLSRQQPERIMACRRGLTSLAGVCRLGVSPPPGAQGP